MVETTTTAADLMSQIATASASGDLTEVIRLGNLLRKQRIEIEKAEALKLQKESEALAGVRAKFQSELLKILIGTKREPGVIAKLDFTSVKATGFVFHADREVIEEGEAIHYIANVMLNVPTVKTRKGVNSGARLTTKDETGLSLSALVAKYGSQDQRDSVQVAYDEAKVNKGTAKWLAQNKVKKEILKAHPELILK